MHLLDKQTKQAAIWIVGSNYLTRLSRDAVLPMLPILAISFSAPEQFLKSLVALYFFAVTASRFVWPALSDFLGIRKVLLLSASIFGLGSAACLVADNIYLFMLGRFLQGFAVGCLPLVTRTMVFQRQGTKKTVKLLGLLSSLMAWSPAAAMLIGGMIADFMSWRWLFVIYLACALGLLIFAVRLKSNNNLHITLGSGQHRKQLYDALQRVSGDREFLQYAIPFSILSACLAAYLTFAPFYFVKQLQISAGQFALLNVVVIAGIVLGKTLVGILVDKFDLHAYYQHALAGAFLSAAVLLIINSTVALSPIYQVLLLAVFFVYIGFLNPLSKTQVMAVVAEYAGTATAVLGGLMGLMSAIVAVVMVFVPSHSMVMLSGVLLLLASFAYGVWFWLDREII